MNRKISALLLTVWLSACTSNPVVTKAISNDSPPVAVASAESTPTENSNQPEAGREAVVSEFENEVAVRATSDGEFIPAEIGFNVQQGGSLQTGENGRARLDLMPEGTIIRVAPNSAFTLPEITETEGKPKTTLSLIFGKIFVLLNGGSLSVETSSGVASVRGSLLSLSFNPETGRFQAACLEGHCALQNENGEEVELLEGESAYVNEDGEVIELDGIDRDEVQEWLDEVPELNEFLDELPDPESHPEFEGFEEYYFDPSTYEEGFIDGGFYNFDDGAQSGTAEPGVTSEPGATQDPGAGDPPPADDSGG